MRCYFHPEHDALYECTICKKAICGDCMRFDEADNVICPACTMENILEIADDDHRTFLEERQRHQERMRENRSKPSMFALVNPLLVVALIALIGLNFFLRHYIGRAGEPALFEPKKFAAVADPALEMTFITSRLFSYAQDHGGKYPAHLSELFPGYLEATPNILGTSEDYIFTPVAQGEDAYVFSLPKADRYGYRRLYFTGDGIPRLE
jgi:hypothetical protein